VWATSILISWFVLTLQIFIKEGGAGSSKLAPKTPNRQKTPSSKKPQTEDQENAVNPNENESVPAQPTSVASVQKCPAAHPPSPARGRPVAAAHPASPARVRPPSAARRKNVQSPAVSRRPAPLSQQTPLHAPTTPRAPPAVHSRQSPVRASGSEIDLTASVAVNVEPVKLAEIPKTITKTEASAPMPERSDETSDTCDAVQSEDDMANENDISLTWKDIYSPIPLTPTTTANPLPAEATVNEVGDAVAELEFDGEEAGENDQDQEPVNTTKTSSGKPHNTPIKVRHTKKSSTASKATPHERPIVPTNDIDFMYPDGRTAGEVAQTFAHNMRHYTGDGGAPKSAKKGPTVNTPSKSSKKATATSSNTDAEGRPSLGTLTMQWQFMRDNFLKGNEEELEWLMVSKNAGAYKHAHKKYCNAEDKYYRSLCETEVVEIKMGIAVTDGRKLQTALANAAAVHLSLQANPGSEDLMEKSLALQATVRTLFNNSSNAADSNNVSGAPITLMTCFCANTQKIIKQYLEEVNRVRMARIASSMEKLILDELKEIPNALMAIRRDGDDALTDMEKWSKRETETNDYAEAMRAQEAEWFQKEETANIAAYKTMRSFIPINVTELTVDAMQTRAKELGGLFSLELILELKKNKLLHWVVTHKEDIAMSNFLVGQSKQFFENIEAYDLVELRAICVCLPEKFELDGDGKKAEWRSRIMNRTKLLASQQARELVKGAWDYANAKRAMVPLPPLKPEQERRGLYYFKTKQQSDQRIKQYIDKENLLKKKRGNWDDISAINKN
jgi:hypothetical protein